MALDKQTEHNLLFALTRSGSSPADARLIVDLAVHAVNEALTMLLTVARRAPSDVLQAQVLMLAYQLVGPAAEAEFSSAREELGL